MDFKYYVFQVPCGNDIVAYGKRRRRRSIPIDIPKDVNKVYEIEMITYLQIGYGDTEKVNKKLTGKIKFIINFFFKD